MEASSDASRHQALQRPRLGSGRCPDAQGHRLRHRQGDQRRADAEDDVHAARADPRDARVHGARAGRDDRARHRHSRRRLRAGRAAVRGADGKQAVRHARRARGRLPGAAADDPGGRSGQAVDARLDDGGGRLGGGCQSPHRSRGPASEPRRRPRLDRDEGAGEGSDAALRDGERVRRRRRPLPRGRARRGRPAEQGLPAAEVRQPQAEDGRGRGGHRGARRRGLRRHRDRLVEHEAGERRARGPAQRRAGERGARDGERAPREGHRGASRRDRGPRTGRRGRGARRPGRGEGAAAARARTRGRAGGGRRLPALAAARAGPGADGWGHACEPRRARARGRTQLAGALAGWRELHDLRDAHAGRTPVPAHGPRDRATVRGSPAHPRGPARSGGDDDAGAGARRRSARPA